MKTVGCIGLGNMGKPMARNLLAKGFRVVVFDVEKPRVEELAGEGAVRAATLFEAAAQSEVLLLSLPNIQVLRTVLTGPDGVLMGEVAGKTIIDTTTATLQITKELADLAKAKDVSFLDAPVTGGVGGAEKGTLTMMVGGDQSAFEQHIDVFNALGSNIVYVGESGHGQISKMVNQLLMGSIYCSVAEAFGFASQLGVDVSKVFQAVENGGARSAVLSSMKQPILSGEYGGGFYLAQHGKDIDYVMDEANRWHSYMPITSAVHEVWNLARTMGFDELNSQSMFAVWERLLNKKLNSTVRGAEKK